MAPKKAKRRAGGGEGSSNVFSMFEQSQIQEYKEAFTIIDQNRDGIISKDDLRDVLASMGQLNVKNEELEAMIKEASGPINFTVFLTMFGEKLKGADPEDVIVSAFKVLDPEATGLIKKQFLEELLTTQCDRFSAEEMKNLWAAFPPDVAGNVDYKNICYVITHGEEKEELVLLRKNWEGGEAHDHGVCQLTKMNENIKGFVPRELGLLKAMPGLSRRERERQTIQGREESGD
ncbi:hypothetical protein QQF64_024890 [Cirrhinus molitorella]|uniref:EF-hand domain-containing protein n=2 Tax=Cirrhinus molitorella TaxID=172907 RepID=A0ABR3NNA1_9TELE